MAAGTQWQKDAGFDAPEWSGAVLWRVTGAYAVIGQRIAPILDEYAEAWKAKAGK